MRFLKKWLWPVYEVWVMFVGLGSFALICLGSVPLFPVLYVLLPKSRHERVARRIISAAFRAYLFMLHWVCTIRCDARELDALRDAGPMIVIANHPSLLDAVMLLSRLPNAACIMKASLLSNPLYGIGARMAGYASNASAPEMILSSRRALSEGAHFVIFPEGGRSREFPVSEFKNACTILARLSGAPIQTVFLDFSTPYLGKHWGLFNPPKLPLLAKARLGKRVPAGEVRRTTLHELEAYFRANVRLGEP